MKSQGREDRTDHIAQCAVGRLAPEATRRPGTRRQATEPDAALLPALDHDLVPENGFRRQVDLVRVSGGDRHHPLSYDTCESCGGIFLESEFADATDAKVAVQEIVAFFKAFSAKKKLAAL